MFPVLSIARSTRNFSLDLTEAALAVRGNKRRLEQAIINLLNNACQALTNTNQRVSISTGLSEDAGCAVITVLDEGRGMDELTLKKIERPFFTTKTAEEGTGLGLTISRDIIKNHGGTLDIQSNPGSGTVVVIRLPQQKC